MQFYSFSKAAPHKTENEDRIATNLAVGNGGLLFVIADGMGGHSGGGVAADLAIKTIEQTLPSKPTEIIDVYSLISDRISEYARHNQKLSSMGTTLTTCLFQDKKVFVSHVGDARVYHLRGEGIMKRTVDQTEIQELINLGVIPREAAKNYHRKNILLSALTAKKDYKVYETSFEVKPRDRVILMTDGAYHMIGLHALSEISIASIDFEVFSRSLEDFISYKGPKDDYSAICIEV